MLFLRLVERGGYEIGIYIERSIRVENLSAVIENQVIPYRTKHIPIHAAPDREREMKRVYEF